MEKVIFTSCFQSNFWESLTIKLVILHTTFLPMQRPPHESLFQLSFTTVVCVFSQDT